GARGIDEERRRRHLVRADTAKVDRQALLEALDHDLENALQVLAVNDGVGDVLQESYVAQLRAQPRFVLLDLRQHVIECVGELIELGNVRRLRAYRVVPLCRHGRGDRGQLEDGT